MFMRRSLYCGHVNYLIYDAEGAHEGRYGCIGGPIWVHVRADMGSCEWAVMGLESLAVSAGVTNHFVTTFSKTCNKEFLKSNAHSKLIGLITVCWIVDMN